MISVIRLIESTRWNCKEDNECGITKVFLCCSNVVVTFPRYQKKKVFRNLIVMEFLVYTSALQSYWNFEEKGSIYGTTTTMKRTKTTSKNNWFYEQNNSSARASRLLVHFFDVHCTNTKWNLLMLRFIEHVNKRRQIFLSHFGPG